MTDMHVRRALRDLEHARSAVRVARFAVAASTVVLGLVVWGWVAAITYGLDGMGQPGINRGNAMAGFTLGLVVLSILTLIAGGNSIEYLAKSLRKRRDASEAYEDEILDSIS